MAREDEFRRAVDLLKGGKVAELDEGARLMQSFLVAVNNDNRSVLREKLANVNWKSTLRTVVDRLESEAEKRSSVAEARATQLSSILRKLVEFADDKLGSTAADLISYAVQALEQTSSQRSNEQDFMQKQWAHTLRILLENPIHRDHIGSKTWNAIFFLCAKALCGQGEQFLSNAAQRQPESQHLFDLSSTTSSLNSNEQQDSKNRSRLSRPADGIKLDAIHEEFARCLAKLFLSLPDYVITPITQRSSCQNIHLTVSKFFATFFQRSYRSTDSNAHTHILSAMNHYLSEAGSNNPHRILELMDVVAPYILDLWDSKSKSRKMQTVLFFQMYTKTHLVFLKQNQVIPLTKTRYQHLATLFTRLHNQILDDQTSKNGTGLLTSQVVEFKYSAGVVLTGSRSNGWQSVNYPRTASRWMLLDLASDVLMIRLQLERLVDNGDVEQVLEEVAYKPLITEGQSQLAVLQNLAFVFSKQQQIRFSLPFRAYKTFSTSKDTVYSRCIFKLPFTSAQGLRLYATLLNHVSSATDDTADSLWWASHILALLIPWLHFTLFQASSSLDEHVKMETQRLHSWLLHLCVRRHTLYIAITSLLTIANYNTESNDTVELDKLLKSQDSQRCLSDVIRNVVVGRNSSNQVNAITVSGFEPLDPTEVQFLIALLCSPHANLLRRMDNLMNSGIASNGANRSQEVIAEQNKLKTFLLQRLMKNLNGTPESGHEPKFKFREWIFVALVVGILFGGDAIKHVFIKTSPASDIRLPFRMLDGVWSSNEKSSFLGWPLSDELIYQQWLRIHETEMTHIVLGYKNESHTDAEDDVALKIVSESPRSLNVDEQTAKLMLEMITKQIEECKNTFTSKSKDSKDAFDLVVRRRVNQLHVAYISSALLVTLEHLGRSNSHSVPTHTIAALSELISSLVAHIVLALEDDTRLFGVRIMRHKSIVEAIELWMFAGDISKYQGSMTALSLITDCISPEATSDEAFSDGLDRNSVFWGFHVQQHSRAQILRIVIEYGLWAEMISGQDKPSQANGRASPFDSFMDFDVRSVVSSSHSRSTTVIDPDADLFGPTPKSKSSQASSYKKGSDDFAVKSSRLTSNWSFASGFAAELYGMPSNGNVVFDDVEMKSRYLHVVGMTLKHVFFQMQSPQIQDQYMELWNSLLDVILIENEYFNVVGVHCGNWLKFLLARFHDVAKVPSTNGWTLCLDDVIDDIFLNLESIVTDYRYEKNDLAQGIVIKIVHALLFPLSTSSSATTPMISTLTAEATIDRAKEMILRWVQKLESDTLPWRCRRSLTELINDMAGLQNDVKLPLSLTLEIENIHSNLNVLDASVVGILMKTFSDAEIRVRVSGRTAIKRLLDLFPLRHSTIWDEILHAITVPLLDNDQTPGTTAKRWIKNASQIHLLAQFLVNSPTHLADAVVELLKTISATESGGPFRQTLEVSLWNLLDLVAREHCNLHDRGWYQLFDSIASSVMTIWIRDEGLMRFPFRLVSDTGSVYKEDGSKIIALIVKKHVQPIATAMTLFSQWKSLDNVAALFSTGESGLTEQAIRKGVLSEKARLMIKKFMPQIFGALMPVHWSSVPLYDAKEQLAFIKEHVFDKEGEYNEMYRRLVDKIVYEALILIWDDNIAIAKALKEFCNEIIRSKNVVDEVNTLQDLERAKTLTQGACTTFEKLLPGKTIARDELSFVNFQQKPFPFLSAKVVLQYMLWSFDKEPVLAMKPARFVSFLLWIQGRIEESLTLRQDQLRLLQIYRMILAIGWKSLVDHPVVSLLVVRFCLHCQRLPWLLDDSVSILNGIFSIMVVNASSRTHLLEHLRRAILATAQQIAEFDCVRSSKDQDTLSNSFAYQLKLLAELDNIKAQDVGVQLKSNYLDCKPIINLIRDQLGEIAQNVSAPNVSLLDSSVPRISLVTALKTLRESLEAPDDAEQLRRLSSKYLPALLRLTSVHNISMVNSDEVLLEVGRCVGLLGFFSDRRDGNGHDQATNRLFSLNSLEDQELLIKTALERIVSILKNGSTSAIQAATRTIRGLLMTELGRRTFCQEPSRSKWIDREVFDLLGVFLSSTKTLKQVAPRKSYPTPQTEELWHCPTETPKSQDMKTYDVWIVTLVNSLIVHCETNDVLGQLGQLFEHDSQFAEQMLPAVIHTVLLKDAQMQSYSMRDTLSKGFMKMLGKVDMEHSKAITTLLSVIDYLRRQSRKDVTPPTVPSRNDRMEMQFDNNFWMDINYYVCSRAAARCGLYESALCYLEIFIEHDQQLDSDGFLHASSFDFSERLDNEEFLRHVLEIVGHSSWGQDGFSGVMQSLTTVDSNILQTQYEQNNSWQKYLSLIESSLQVSGGGSRGEMISNGTRFSANTSNLLHSLLKLGYNHIADTYLLGANRGSSPRMITSAANVLDLPDANNLSEIHYEAMWKNSQWHHDTETQSMNAESLGFHGLLFNSMRTLAKSVTGMDFADPTRKAILHIVRTGDKFASAHNTYEAEKTILPLIILREIEESQQVLMSLNRENVSKNISDSGSECVFMDVGLPDANLNELNHFKKYLHKWNDRLSSLTQSKTFTEIRDWLDCRTVLLETIYRQIINFGVQGNCERVSRLNISALVGNSLFRHLIAVSQLARKEKINHLSQISLTKARHLLAELDMHAKNSGTLATVDHEATNRKCLIMLESAKALASQGDVSLGVRILREAIDNGNAVLQQLSSSSLTGIGLTRTMARCLKRAAQWSFEQRSEKPRDIIEKYFEVAAGLMERYRKDRIRSTDILSDDIASNGAELGYGVFYWFARYCDNQYEVVTNDDTWEATEDLRKLKEHELKNATDMLRTKTLSGIERRNLDNNRRKIEMIIEADKKEYQRMQEERMLLLYKAIENYIKCLLFTEKHDLAALRFISLWFANREHDKVSELLMRYINSLETRKFISLIYQLSARLSHSDRSVFQHALSSLIEKMIVDHPYHTMYQIIALKNGHMGSGVPEASVAGSSGTKSTAGSKRKRGAGKEAASMAIQDATEEKVQAAGRLLERVRGKSTRLNKIVTDMDHLVHSYIELSQYPVDGEQLKRTRQFKMDPKLKIVSIQNRTHVPVTSIEIPIDPSCQYSAIVYIQGFKPVFEVPGGINVPKAIQCLGSDGNIYIQLVKSRDDLRQDAVISKIFHIVNLLFNKTLSTRKRSLSIRTYKVVPFSPTAGLLEWVTNTRPFGDYLRTAHVIYGRSRGDIDPMQARKKMQQEFETKGSSPLTKLKTLKEIYARMRPVFRHFFWDTFKDPSVWLERRLSYTKSVATSSIVGYLVGLGDRHAHNILVDTRTAEVIHIDLGIAFDAGKLLSIPELVPFRLTRDVIDGMGLMGVEGVFRRCCEETLKVLRREKDIIVTVAEVLKYDPLHQWRLSTVKLAKQFSESNVGGMMDQDDVNLRSTSSSTTTNKDAERAILSVKKKLSDALSVECHVNELIESARNEELLCRMFYGWQPWL